MSDLVTYTVAGSVATIAMDDGKRNALSVAMLQALRVAFDQAEREASAVVFTGREGVFSAGFDLAVFKAGGAPLATMLREGFALAERLLSFPKPVLVACTGHAVAMGAMLLLACDYRIGVTGPFKVATNEVTIGLTMPHAGVELCRQRLVPAHFHRAVSLAEVYSPEGAVEAGFFDRVATVAELSEFAGATAAQLAKLSPAAHAATKLRVRAQTLAAMRAASEQDAADFQVLG